MLTQQFLSLSSTPPSSAPPYRKLNPFQRSGKTWANLFIELEIEESLTPTMLNTLCAVIFQQDTRRKLNPFTYMEMGLRTKQKRNTIAWDLHHLHRKELIKKGQHEEEYLQKNGFTGKTALCKRIRTIQLPSDELIEKKKQRDQEARKEITRLKKEKIAEKRKKLEEEKTRKNNGLRNTTPRGNPPASYGSDRSSEVQVTPNLVILKALFEENKIRSYKMDGDMRCRCYVSKTLKDIKMADLLLAVTLFAQNRFLMDANAHGWTVARANALRRDGQEPWVNGKSLNGYKDWCPSMVWFVRNIHKILEGAYNQTTHEERARMREKAQEVQYTSQPSFTPSVPSSGALALTEKKRLEREAQEMMDLQVQRDREATQRAKPYWNELKIEDRYRLETQFIEAIKKGETTYPSSTNTADKFFKMMKESALLTWLGYQLPEN